MVMQRQRRQSGAEGRNDQNNGYAIQEGQGRRVAVEGGPQVHTVYN